MRRFILLITLLTACSANPPVPDESGERRDYRSVEGEPKEEEPEPDASVKAESETDAAADRLTRRQMMRLAGRYQRRLVKAIDQQWEPPELSDQRLAALGDRTVVYIRLDADGHITSFEFRQKSQAPAFNESITRCLKTFTDEGGGRTLPLPEHPQVRRAIIKRGINLQRWRKE